MGVSNNKPLYWESTYEIVLRLQAVYFEIDLDSLGTEQLLAMIVALPEFADDPRLANEGILTEILREWYEEAMY
jgi:FeS assembly protein IscX